MGTIFDKNLRLITILISALSIIILQLDFFITDEFMLESIFNIGLSVLLLINIVGNSTSRIYTNKLLSYSINGLIILTGLYCIKILLLLYWGYGFTGRDTPFIWTPAFLLNLLLLFTSCIKFMPK